MINAEGESQAAAKLAEAAEVIQPNPVTIQLRYLQALTDISGNQGSTIVFPLPLDLIRPFLDLGEAEQGEGEGDSAASGRPPRRDSARARPGSPSRPGSPGGRSSSTPTCRSARTRPRLGRWFPSTVEGPRDRSVRPRPQPGPSEAHR